MKKKSFTILELLVVMTLIVIISSLVAPKGIKLLDNFDKYISNLKGKLFLQNEISGAFFSSEKKQINYNDKQYIISEKGFVIDTKESNFDN